METNLDAMVAGSYHTDAPMIFIEASERTKNLPQELVLIHESTHKLLIELTEPGNLLRALLSRALKINFSDHPYVRQYFSTTRALHECFATTVESIYSHRLPIIHKPESYFTKEYMGYYQLLSDFHPYLIENTSNNSEKIVLQLGLLVLGQPFKNEIILTAEGIIYDVKFSHEDIRARFKDACKALEIGITKHKNNIDKVLEVLVEEFPHEWCTVDQIQIDQLLLLLPNGHFKNLFKQLTSSYSKDKLPIDELFRRVVHSSAKEAVVHFTGKLNAVEICVEQAEKINDLSSGLYIHFYPNTNDFPIDFIVTIQPGTCLIFLDAFDRSLVNEDEQSNPYESKSRGQFVLSIPNKELSVWFAKFISYKKNMVVIDPSFFDSENNSVFETTIPKERTVYLYDPVGRAIATERFAYNSLHKASINALYNQIYAHGNEKGSYFCCIRPLEGDSWLYMSPKFENIEIDKFVGGIGVEMILPKSCKGCSSNSEFGMTWKLEEPILYLISHNTLHGW